MRTKKRGGEEIWKCMENDGAVKEVKQLKYGGTEEKAAG